MMIVQEMEFGAAHQLSLAIRVNGNRERNRIKLVGGVAEGRDERTSTEAAKRKVPAKVTTSTMQATKKPKALLPRELTPAVAGDREIFESRFGPGVLGILGPLLKARKMSPLLTLQVISSVASGQAWWLHPESILNIQAWLDCFSLDHGYPIFTDNMVTPGIAWTQKEMEEHESALKSFLNSHPDATHTFGERTPVGAGKIFWPIFKNEFPSIPEEELPKIQKKCKTLREKLWRNFRQKVHQISSRGGLLGTKKPLPFQQGLFRHLPHHEMSFIPWTHVKTMPRECLAAINILDRDLARFFWDRWQSKKKAIRMAVNAGTKTKLQGNDSVADAMRIRGGSSTDDEGDLQPPPAIPPPPPPPPAHAEGNWECWYGVWYPADQEAHDPADTAYVPHVLRANSGVSLYKTVAPGGAHSMDKDESGASFQGSIHTNSNLLWQKSPPKRTDLLELYERAQELQQRVVDVICRAIKETFGHTAWFKGAMEMLKDIPNEHLLPGVPCSHIWWTRNPFARTVHHDHDSIPPAFVFCPATNDFGGGELIVHLNGRTMKIPMTSGTMVGGAWAQFPHCTESVAWGNRRSFVVYLDHRVISKSFKFVS